MSRQSETAYSPKGHRFLIEKENTMDELKHVMIDIESLAISADAHILSIGACSFRFTSEPERCIVNSFHYATLCHDRAIDYSTVMWWLRQSDEARGAVVAIQQTAIELGIVLDQLSDFIKVERDDHAYIWCKQRPFDQVILENAYDQYGEEPPWKYNGWQDVATIEWIAKYLDIDPPTFPCLEHDALEDAKYQARRINWIVENCVEDRNHLL